MMSHEYQNPYSTIAIFRIFQRFLGRTRLFCRRYAQWHQRKRDHEALLRMEDRMLKDIGLSRSDIRRMGRDRNFWRHMFQPEEGNKKIEPHRKVAAICDVEPIQDHSACDFCLHTPVRSLSRN